MQITQSVLSLNVNDIAASARWASAHLGYTEAMAAPGFVSLSHPTGVQLVYLRVGLETFAPASAAGHADGLLVVFVVENIDAEYSRLQQEGVTVVTPIQTEAWGERFFQMSDPNGVVYQLVQWMT